MAECAIAFPPYKPQTAGPIIWKITGAKFLDGIYFVHAKLSSFSYTRWVLFFTVNLLERNNTLLVDHIDLLRESIRLCKQKHPFHIDAWVVLPEHMHCIWTLPEGDDDFSNRWKMIKTQFSKGLPKVERRSKVRIKRGERGIWQRRFWEHAIRHDRDYVAHMDYLHFNPVKHGWVDKVIDWPYSSFHLYVKRGLYPVDWTNFEHNEVEMGELT